MQSMEYYFYPECIQYACNGSVTEEVQHAHIFLRNIARLLAVVVVYVLLYVVGMIYI